MPIFSHDGLKDFFTHLAAPPLFYDALHRETSRFARSGDPFVVIKFELQTTSVYEEKVLDFAHTLSEVSRIEDLCARMGEYEFAILIPGQKELADKYVARVAERWKEECESIKFWSAFAQIRAGESSLELLNRLDRCPLREAFTSF